MLKKKKKYYRTKCWFINEINTFSFKLFFVTTDASPIVMFTAKNNILFSVFYPLIHRIIDKLKTIWVGIIYKVIKSVVNVGWQSFSSEGGFMSSPMFAYLGPLSLVFIFWFVHRWFIILLLLGISSFYSFVDVVICIPNFIRHCWDLLIFTTLL